MNSNWYTDNRNPVPITYTDAELNDIIAKYISESRIEFYFNDLCYSILYKAKQEKKVKDAEHVAYLSSDLSYIDLIRVSRILWEYIWKKELFIAFGDSKNQSYIPGNTRFIKTNI